jgi:hypothetical protein
VSKPETWTTPKRRVSNIIREYDLRAAGLSAALELELISLEQYDDFLEMRKKERQIAIGKMYLQDKDFAKAVEGGIAKAVKDFCELNEIQRSDIVSIKRDAVYCTSQCSEMNVGEHLEFREVGVFSSFVKAPGVEFYYSSWDSSIQVKGISPEKLVLHENYMLNSVKSLIALAEQDDSSLVLKAARKLRLSYIRAELEIGFYREFNAGSLFRMERKLAGHEMVTNLEVPLEEIDHRYNLYFMTELFGALLGE